MKRRTAVRTIDGYVLDDPIQSLKRSIDIVGAIQIALESEAGYDDFYSNVLYAAYRYMLLLYGNLENLVYCEIEVPESENKDNIHDSGESPV